MFAYILFVVPLFVTGSATELLEFRVLLDDMAIPVSIIRPTVMAMVMNIFFMIHVLSWIIFGGLFITAAYYVTAGR